jgi:hypothetical protein
MAWPDIQYSNGNALGNPPGTAADYARRSGWLGRFIIHKHCAALARNWIEFAA